MDAERLSVGGRPIVALRSDAPTGLACAVTDAVIAPGRGMMLLQATGRHPGLGSTDILYAPPLEQAAATLDAGGADDFAGNLAFSFGGAILLPYANRIRGGAV